MNIFYPKDHIGSEMYCVNLYAGPFMLLLLKWILAQEILNNFFEAIGIYCFNRAEMPLNLCLGQLLYLQWTFPPPHKKGLYSFYSWNLKDSRENRPIGLRSTRLWNGGTTLGRGKSGSGDAVEVDLKSRVLIAVAGFPGSSIYLAVGQPKGKSCNRTHQPVCKGKGYKGMVRRGRKELQKSALVTRGCCAMQVPSPLHRGTLRLKADECTGCWTPCKAPRCLFDWVRLGINIALRVWREKEPSSMPKMEERGHPFSV